MFSSNAFDYINVLDRAADASALRNEVIANNIANVDTPGFKREDVSFEKELDRALRHNKYETMDSKVANIRTDELRPRVYTDIDGFSYRYDENSVDMDAEATYLAENQLKYEGLMNSLTSEFKNLQTVMK